MKTNEQKGKQKAMEYYSQEAGDYIRMYTKKWDKYPANLIRIKFIIDSIQGVPSSGWAGRRQQYDQLR